MEAPILAALAVLVVVLAWRRRRRIVRRKLLNPRTSRSAAAGHEPLIRQNHQDWKDAVYNPKEHRSRPGG